MRPDTYWDAVESLDADLLASLFAAGGSFQLAEQAPVTGREAIRRAFVQLFVEIETIEHRTVAAWNRGGLFVSDADLTLTFSDGRLFIPTTTILWTRESEILSCRLLLYPEPALERFTRFFLPSFTMDPWANAPLAASSLV